MIQPKPFLDKLHLRFKKEGNAQRIDMSLKILDKGTPLPLPVEYKDIDACMQKWVEDELYIAYDGEKIPTFKLFSNQRLNEYAETWKHVDNNGNLLMNFKTITRDMNPQKGENQGNYYNIPGDRDYPMFLVPVLQDNQQVAYDMYSMKQPFSVNFEYTIGIVTNKYELINKMNQMIHDKFKAINVYIYPNNHPMPLTLEQINDESEYNIDDRKYYSQTFKMKLKAYIIKEEDFKVTKIPSRINVNTVGENKKKQQKNSDIVKEGYWDDNCHNEEKSKYYYQKVIINLNFDLCQTEKIIINNDITIRDIETYNVYDFMLLVNGEKQNLEEEINIYKDDEISVKITKDDVLTKSTIKIIGFDPNVIYDTTYDAESSLDEQKNKNITL